MTVAVHRPIASAGLLPALRSLLVLSVLAFLAGFGGYLILGPPHVMGAATASPAVETVATPAEQASETQAPDWNPPKQV